MADRSEPAALRLTRDPGDGGPSLADRLSDRLDRLSFASPFHRMRLKGRFPLKLLAQPVDPVPGDSDRGLAVKGGRLLHGGHGGAMGDVCLDDPAAPAQWRRWVDGWGWLRDLATTGPAGRGEIARAESLARRWLARFHDYDAIAWAPDVTGQRILMVCAHAPLVMSGNDHIHRSAVLNGVARWARHLDRAAPRLPMGRARLEALAGLMGAALVLPGGEDRCARSATLLADTLDALLLPDGGGVARSPLQLAQIGDRLLLLAAFHHARGLPPAAAVAEGLERVRIGLSALAMGDGLPACWHGGQPGRAQMARLCGTPVDRPPSARSGFQRMAAGGVRLVMDAGPPPAARANGQAHASTLAIQMSDGAHALLVSCGAAHDQDGPRDLPPELVTGLRSTAAHSTLILADTNSSRPGESGPRQQGGVSEVLVETRATAEGQWLEARHDGYRRRFGFDHVRRLWLSPAGDDLRGEDQLAPAGRLSRMSLSDPLPVALRFHLGPDAEAILAPDGSSAIVRLAGQRGWAFRASFNHAPGRLSVEPSLHLDAAGHAHQVQQLLLTSLVRNGQPASIGWSFRRVDGR